MTQDVVRIVKAWLGHATYGAAVYLATVPVETGVTRLSGFTLSSSADDPTSARKNAPLGQRPFLQVVSTADPERGTNPGIFPTPPDRTLSIGVRFGMSVNSDDDMSAVLSYGDQINRAVHKSLRQMMGTAAGEAARTRNGVQIIRWVDSTVMEGLSNDDTLFTLTILLTLEARDTFANS